MKGIRIADRTGGQSFGTWNSWSGKGRKNQMMKDDMYMTPDYASCRFFFSFRRFFFIFRSVHPVMQR